MKAKISIVDQQLFQDNFLCYNTVISQFICDLVSVFRKKQQQSFETLVLQPVAIKQSISIYPYFGHSCKFANLVGRLNDKYQFSGSKFGCRLVEVDISESGRRIEIFYVYFLVLSSSTKKKPTINTIRNKLSFAVILIYSKLHLASFVCFVAYILGGFVCS